MMCVAFTHEQHCELSHCHREVQNVKSTAYLRTEPTDGTIHWRSVPSPIRSRIPAWRHRSRCQSASMVAVCWVGGEDMNAWMAARGWAMEPGSGVADGTDYRDCPITIAISVN